MNKKVLLLIISLIIFAVVGIGIYFVIQKDNKVDNNGQEKDSTNQTTKENENEGNENKSLVLYFSATGTTKEVAKKIAKLSNSDIIEIIPKEKYTSADLSYNNDNCRANKEQNDDKARPEIANEISIEEYDTIYLGYPIWWGTAPKIILSLLDNYDFSGKNLRLFCTSGGSSINQSITDLKNYNKDLNIKDGRKFSSNENEKNIEEWLRDMKG